MKNIQNLKSLYLKWLWSFPLEFFKNVLLGLAFLYNIQIKSPKTFYLTEQCQLIPHRNSVHSVRRGTKMSKMSCPWYRNLIVYSAMHLKLKHTLTAFLSFYWLHAIQIDHEIFSAVILSLPLIQEGQLSVSGERMCTILVNRLED